MALRVTTQRRVLQGVGNGALVLMLLWTAIPFYWMIATSLKHDKEIYGYEATLIPQRPTLANYATVFRETPYLLYLRNSLAVAVGSTSTAAGSFRAACRAGSPLRPTARSGSRTSAPSRIASRSCGNGAPPR